MKYLQRFIIALSVIIVPVALWAQDGSTPAPFDVGALFGSSAALAAFVITAVQFVRSHLWKTLDGWTSIAFTFALSVALSIVGWYFHLLTVTDIGSAIGFGAGAAIIAIGGVNLAQKTAAKAALQVVDLPSTEVAEPEKK